MIVNYTNNNDIYNELFTLANNVLNTIKSTSQDYITIDDNIYNFTPDIKSDIDENFTDITSLQDYLSWINILAQIHPRFARLPLEVDEPFFNIDLNTRRIIPPIGNYTWVCKGDQKAETLFFKVSRYHETQDLYNDLIKIIVQASYINENGQSSQYSCQLDNKDIYSFKDELVFGWTIPNILTMMSGTITYSIRFYYRQELTPYLTYNLATLPSTLEVKDTLNFDLLSDLVIKDETGGLQVGFNPLNSSNYGKKYVEVIFEEQDDENYIIKFLDPNNSKKVVSATAELYLNSNNLNDPINKYYWYRDTQFIKDGNNIIFDQPGNYYCVGQYSLDSLATTGTTKVWHVYGPADIQFKNLNSENIFNKVASWDANNDTYYLNGFDRNWMNGLYEAYEDIKNYKIISKENPLTVDLVDGESNFTEEKNDNSWCEINGNDYLKIIFEESNNNITLTKQLKNKVNGDYTLSRYNKDNTEKNDNSFLTFNIQKPLMPEENYWITTSNGMQIVEGIYINNNFYDPSEILYNSNLDPDIININFNNGYSQLNSPAVISWNIDSENSLINIELNEQSIQNGFNLLHFKVLIGALQNINFLNIDENNPYVYSFNEIINNFIQSVSCGYVVSNLNISLEKNSDNIYILYLNIDFDNSQATTDLGFEFYINNYTFQIDLTNKMIYQNIFDKIVPSYLELYKDQYSQQIYYYDESYQLLKQNIDDEQSVNENNIININYLSKNNTYPINQVFTIDEIQSENIKFSINYEDLIETTSDDKEFNIIWDENLSEGYILAGYLINSAQVSQEEKNRIFLSSIINKKIEVLFENNFPFIPVIRDLESLNTFDTFASNRILKGSISDNTFFDSLGSLVDLDENHIYIVNNNEIYLAEKNGEQFILQKQNFLDFNQSPSNSITQLNDSNIKIDSNSSAFKINTNLPYKNNFNLQKSLEFNLDKSEVENVIGQSNYSVASLCISDIGPDETYNNMPGYCIGIIPISEELFNDVYFPLLENYVNNNENLQIETIKNYKCIKIDSNFSTLNVPNQFLSYNPTSYGIEVYIYLSQSEMMLANYKDDITIPHVTTGLKYTFQESLKYKESIFHLLNNLNNSLNYYYKYDDYNINKEEDTVERTIKLLKADDNLEFTQLISNFTTFNNLNSYIKEHPEIGLYQIQVKDTNKFEDDDNENLKEIYSNAESSSINSFDSTFEGIVQYSDLNYREVNEGYAPTYDENLFNFGDYLLEQNGIEVTCVNELPKTINNDDDNFSSSDHVYKEYKIETYNNGEQWEVYLEETVDENNDTSKIPLIIYIHSKDINENPHFTLDPGTYILYNDINNYVTQYIKYTKYKGETREVSGVFQIIPNIELSSETDAEDIDDI